MTTMESRGQSGRAKLGSRIVLIASLAFVAGGYVPAYRDNGYRFDIYHSLFWHDGGLGTIGLSLLLFSGAVAAVALALIGGWLREPIWLPPALAVAVIIWALTWTGFLLTIMQDRKTLLVGYWIVAGSLVVGVAGAIIAVRSRSPATPHISCS